MLAKRIIPCLDIREGQTVKGINFVGLRNVGDPVELGAKYAAEGADELVYLDISATEEGRQTFTELVARIAEHIDIPFTVGGGIASVADAGRLLDAGADKVTVNSAAVRDPALIDAIASKYGSQFVVAAIDARMTDGVWRVTTHGGKRLTERELFAWALEEGKKVEYRKLPLAELREADHLFMTHGGWAIPVCELDGRPYEVNAAQVEAINDAMHTGRTHDLALTIGPSGDYEF